MACTAWVGVAPSPTGARSRTDTGTGRSSLTSCSRHARRAVFRGGEVASAVMTSDVRRGGAASRLDAGYREAAWHRLSEDEFDVVVIGGGVTGAGAALDAATRGLSVALVEARDWASGTSSRSSKLFHGGFALPRAARVRAGARGAARTRADDHPARAAPGEAGGVPVPADAPGWERPYVAAGLALYDTIGGHSSLPGQKHLSRRAALRMFPGLRDDAFVGAVRYFDAQADDARHTLTVARTAARYGAVVRSSTQAVGFRRESDRVVGVVVRDTEDGRETDVRAGVVLNCTGVWTDSIQALSGGARTIPGPRLQGRAHRRRARTDRRRRRADPAHREFGAVRHPVEDALDHRHHRHRLEPRSRAPCGDEGGHRLPARAGQQRARHAAGRAGHRGRLRGSAAAARRRVRGDLGALARARRRPGRARAGLHRRRQVHDLPGDGRRRGRRRRRGAAQARRAVVHRPGAAARRRRLLRDAQPDRGARRGVRAAPLPGARPARPVRLADPRRARTRPRGPARCSRPCRARRTT